MKKFNAVVGFLLSALIPTISLGVEPSNQFKFGDGTASDKTIIGNTNAALASKPKIKYSNSAARWQVLHDGTTPKAINDATALEGLVPEASGGTGTALPANSAALRNVGISATAAANQLTVNLTQADGSTCSSASYCKIPFRSPTVTSGTFEEVKFLAAMTLTVPTTCGMGNGGTYSVYLIQDSTNELCISGKLFDDSVVQTASAISGCTTSATTLYCTAAHTSRPLRLLGTVSAPWSNPNWGTPTAVSRFTTGSVGTGQIADGAVTQEKMYTRAIGVSVTAGNVAIANDSGSNTITSQTFTKIDNQEITLETTGRPVVVTITGTSTATANREAYLIVENTEIGVIQFYEDGTLIGRTIITNQSGGANPIFTFITQPAAGSHTYILKGAVLITGKTLTYSFIRLMAYEL